jgi:adenylate cyclase
MGASTTTAIPGPTGLRDVLVIEDDTSIRETIAALLEHAGFSAQTAPDGLDALRMIERRRPDLIVLDMMLPSLSGWQFLERLRSHTRGRPVPVLIHSAIDEPNDDAETLGVTRWLTKPVEADRFLRTVRELVGPSLPRVLVVDDERTIRELLVEHLCEEGFVAESAGSVAEAYPRLREQRPDAIVLDLMLPGQSGWDFLRLRRADPLLRRIPVMVISAATQSRLELAQELGADALVSKPFDLNQVTAQLHQLALRH